VRNLRVKQQQTVDLQQAAALIQDWLAA